VIVQEAEQAGFDPLLIGVLIGKESSFKTDVTGFAKGEIGLLQVHGRCAKGYDLTQPAEQIRAGVGCLVIGRDKCGDDLRRILTAYASGSCKARTKRTKFMISTRLRLWREARERYYENTKNI
jgi:hypothetical protein